MEKLGYIVYDRNIKDLSPYVEQVNDMSKVTAPLPVLIIGWKKAKEHPNYKSVLDKHLEENVWWTFGKTESRSDFESDLKEFYEEIFRKRLDNIKYYYVNIYKLRYSSLKKLIDIIYSTNKKTIYISGKMIYIPHNGNVLGISLDLLEYNGIKKGKVVYRFLQNVNNSIVRDSDWRVSNLLRRLGNKRYAVPYFI